MGTLYLHIGTPKTGTTAIQEFCRLNGRALEKRGFCYPGFPSDYALPNGRFLRWWIGTEKKEDPRDLLRAWQGKMERLARLFRRYPNIILSEEMLWCVPESRRSDLWGKLKEEADARGFDVRVIVYLRRQDQFLTSYWAEQVKSCWGGGTWSKMRWEDVLARAGSYSWLDYCAKLEGIAAYFGRERIDVRIYERERFPGGDIIADFMGALGLPLEADYRLPKGDDNPSIGGNAMEIKRIINALPEHDGRMEAVARRIACDCYAWERSRARYSMFSPEELEAFLRRYEESNRRVARDYLGSADEPLFAPPGELPPKWEPNNPEMQESLVRFIGAMMLSR